MTQTIRSNLGSSPGWEQGDRPYHHSTVRVGLPSSAPEIPAHPEEALNRLRLLLEQEALGRDLSFASLSRFFRDTTASYNIDNPDFENRHRQSQINLSMIQEILRRLSTRPEYAQQLESLLSEFDRIQGFLELEETFRNGTSVLGTDTFQRMGVFINMGASIAGQL